MRKGACSGKCFGKEKKPSAQKRGDALLRIIREEGIDRERERERERELQTEGVMEGEREGQREREGGWKKYCHVYAHTGSVTML